MIDDRTVPLRGRTELTVRVFAATLAWGLAVAIGVGVALGRGGHTYVEENTDRWANQASSVTPEPRG